MDLSAILLHIGKEIRALLYFDESLLCVFQVTASGQTRVVIEDVRVNHSGTYLCEVTVTPSYFALMQYANMTVIGEYEHVSNR